MRICRLHSWCLVFVLLACGTARAQDHGNVGITMAYPASVGVIWHATPAVAVRPDFSFQTTHTEGASVSTDSWTIATGVSGLFYVSTADSVRTYISPRLSYTRGHASADSSIIEASNHAWGVSGSFGAEVRPASKFSVFGEVGVLYTRSTADNSGFTSFETRSSATGMRAGVGVIFYP